MVLVKTGDSSYTYLNKGVGETYHSVSGGFEEAFGKFVIPSTMVKLCSRGFTVFDVCFGLGYNSAAALHFFLEHFSKGGFMELVGFENDRQILNKIASIEVPEFIEDAYSPIRLLVKELHNGKPCVKSDIFSLRLDFGDARVRIIQERRKANIVLFDPFSPKRAPDMWSYEFLKTIYNKMERGGVLTTFSCARVTRENLKRCGFRVSNGPRIGRKAPSTIAVK